MRIHDFLEYPGIIIYEIWYKNPHKNIKIILYRSYNLSCFNRIQIERNELEITKSHVVNTITKWKKPLSIF